MGDGRLDARLGGFLFDLNQREGTSKCFVRRGLHVTLCCVWTEKMPPGDLPPNQAREKGGVWEIAVQCENARP